MPRDTTEKIECPHCGSRLSAVRQTYNIKFRNKTMVIRRRQCVHCGEAYKSKETIMSDDEEIKLQKPSPPTPENIVPKPLENSLKNPFLQD